MRGTYDRRAGEETEKCQTDAHGTDDRWMASRYREEADQRISSAFAIRSEVRFHPCKFQCQSSLAHRTAGRFEQCHQGLISHHRRLQRGTSAFRQPPQNNVLLLL